MYEVPVNTTEKERIEMNTRCGHINSFLNRKIQAEATKQWGKT